MLIFLCTFESESDREKFEFIYHNYTKLMLHKAYGVLGDYMLAEDAVSEAMIRIYRNLRKIDDPGSNRSLSFVVTIAKNAALTLRAKMLSTQVDEVDDSIPDDTDLEGQVLSDMTSDSILALMDELGDDLRAVFVLHFSHGLSHSEIADTLGITENNVSVRLHRAKSKLAKILVREGYVHDTDA